MSESALLIGSLDSEFIRVTPRARSGNDPSDYWDSNWLASDIEVSCGPFSGSVRANLRTDEFASFSRELAGLYDDLSGQARFTSLERWLAIQVSGDGRGQFVAECEVRDDPSWGAALRFTLHFDQTQISAILRGLEAVEGRFPVLGSSAE